MVVVVAMVAMVVITGMVVQALLAFVVMVCAVVEVVMVVEVVVAAAVRQVVAVLPSAFGGRQVHRLSERVQMWIRLALTAVGETLGLLRAEIQPCRVKRQSIRMFNFNRSNAVRHG